MFAANTGRLDIVKALMEGVILENGEERKFPVDQINAQDVKGFTALHAAAMASSRPDSRRQVITLLFDHNIDPTLVDATGKTALELAESRGNRVVADAIKDEIEKRKSAEHGLLLATSLEPQTYTPGFTSNSSASQVSVTRETKDVSVEASVTESPTSKPLFPSP